MYNGKRGVIKCDANAACGVTGLSSFENEKESE